MKILINNFTPVPSISVIGCAESRGLERMEIQFDEKWDKLKKEVTFYLSDDDSVTVTVPYKASPIIIPDSVTANSGICRYVVKGVGRRKKLVSRTGFLSVLPVPESSPADRDKKAKGKVGDTK